jgi:hypothetical protein
MNFKKKAQKLFPVKNGGAMNMPTRYELENALRQEGFLTCAKFVEIEKVKAQLQLLRNFYYGKDLKDKDIRAFYKDVFELAKKELSEQLKELKKKKNQ